MAHHHRIAASPDTVHWGYFDAALKPLLTIPSGDTVTMECVSCTPEAVPPPGSPLKMHPAAEAILKQCQPKLGRHMLTGPVAIEGAEPGDMLEVKIEAIELGWDWGYNNFRPLVGTIPEDFPYLRILHIPVDRAERTCALPWGTRLALRPFFGVMGVAPPAVYSAIGSKEPREHGGNLDNKELVAGTTLFLPVYNKGALFSCGDGHGVQGDGEVCVTALEMCLTGTFTFHLHKAQAGRKALAFPRAETPTHFISMGLNEDLDQAMKQALREMIAFIAGRSNLSPADAYQLCSLAVDFRVTQTVNGVKGVHGMLAKNLI
ncbi:MAG: acetamidase/formamidase family protein [Alphaproteobacteria bacterium]|nr:acetamidase/formamidase family protein [Alphaproteobacteria bacterium]